jgi:hypothetical protein
MSRRRQQSATAGRAGSGSGNPPPDLPLIVLPFGERNAAGRKHATVTAGERLSRRCASTERAEGPARLGTRRSPGSSPKCVLTPRFLARFGTLFALAQPKLRDLDRRPTRENPGGCGVLGMELGDSNPRPPGCDPGASGSWKRRVYSDFPVSACGAATSAPTTCIQFATMTTPSRRPTGTPATPASRPWLARRLPSRAAARSSPRSRRRGACARS